MRKTIRLLGIIALVAIIGFTMAACGNGTTGDELSFDPGDGAGNIGRAGEGGGIIYYYDEAGFTVAGIGTCHYLEVAPVKLGPVAWASPAFASTSISTLLAYGQGKQNTLNILEADPDSPAAKACAEHKGGGKTDWYFPSREELSQIYTEIGHLGHFSGIFWGSSNPNATNARTVDFSNGDIGQDTKTNTHYVLPVRAF